MPNQTEDPSRVTKVIFSMLFLLYTILNWYRGEKALPLINIVFAATAGEKLWQINIQVCPKNQWKQ